MNFLEKIFLQKRKNTKTLSLDEAAKILKADPKFLDKFEEMYRKADSSEKRCDNLFDINAKQAAEEKEGVAPKFRKKAEENWIPGDTSLSD